MTTHEITEHLEHLLKYVRYSEDAPALREAIEMLKCSEIPNSSDERTDKRTETHACDFENLPSAQPEPCEDFVKVVRCKKCRYVHCDKEFDNYWCNRMSGAFMVEAEGFCKWGR